MDTFARPTAAQKSDSAQTSEAVQSWRSLHHSAWHYRKLGYSIIPLVGDFPPGSRQGHSNRSPKQPAIPWKDYQRRLPEAHELDTWFRYEQYKAIGVVTGAVSSLLVFDFDAPGLYEAFSAACPALVATHTVRTARGRHLYFHVAPGLTLPSRKIPGLDIQGEGRYVVAPPSIINGHCYTVEIDQPPHNLTDDDIKQIGAFLAAQTQHDSALYADMLRTELTKPGKAATPHKHSDAAETEQPHNSSLMNLHSSLATHLGSRNAALYRLSHQLRRSGHSESETIALLARLHADAKPLGPHAPETPAQRIAEAHRTIRSVYESAYAPPIPTNGMNHSPQPNTTTVDQALREHLLQRDLHNGTAFLRVYEGLLSQGIKPGEQLTRRHMTALLQPLGIGRPAIERAVNALDKNGHPLLPPHKASHKRSGRVSPRNAPPGPPVYTDEDSVNRSESLSFFVPPNGVQMTNPTKIQRHMGRPAIWYEFPSMDDLCQRLGIRPAGGGDPIQRDDLASPAAYRSSLEHSFIKRRPGRYFLALLAERLGISTRSIQRYHDRTNVQSLPTYAPVAELSLERLDGYLDEFSDRRKPSKFSLLDDRGKRYPARYQTAKWLLHCKRKVMLMQRGPNLYWVDKPPIGALARHQLGSYQVAYFKPNRLQETAMRLMRILQRHFEQAAARATDEVHTAQQASTTENPSTLSAIQTVENLTRAAIWSGREHQPSYQPRLIPDTPAPKPHFPPPERPKRFYRQELADSGSEKLAIRIHEFTNPNKTKARQNQRGSQKDKDPKGLSLANARRLIEIYGYTAVIKALNTAIWMQQKSILRNPAGMIIEKSRLNWRAEHPQAIHEEVPKFQAEKRAARRKKRKKRDKGEGQAAGEQSGTGT
ncbi:MAG: hypothetical protein D6742_05650 [Cyanobacteria bacterium J069]|nr:MAG: hypothetical protein D6742_05650 [Cyanobacteria bacterium J069]